jgi:hypothetical protein
LAFAVSHLADHGRQAAALQQQLFIFKK